MQAHAGWRGHQSPRLYGRHRLWLPAVLPTRWAQAQEWRRNRRVPCSPVSRHIWKLPWFRPWRFLEAHALELVQEVGRVTHTIGETTVKVENTSFTPIRALVVPAFATELTLPARHRA